MITSIFPNEKSKLIHNKLSNYCFINDKGILYALQKNITYLKITDIENKLITFVTLLLEESFKGLSEDDRERITDKFEKTYSIIFKNSHVRDYMPQLQTILRKDDIVFDKYFDKIHFNNGYVDLSTLKFMKRVKHTYYITAYIKYDYKPSTTEQRNKVMHHISKIYANKADRKAIIMELAFTLSGRATTDQSTLFLLGEGSSG